jgi:ATP-dependent DNA helicase RecG
LAGGILPFTPTRAQLRVLGEIDHDLRLVQPMQRLLQGDVGSGKTAVALTAAAALARAGLQTALMVPTELLAEQHARTAAKLLTPLGISSALLTGSTPAARRRSLLADLRSGALSLLIGTHAVIQDTVVFAALALGIVDEQHRFGVLQRAQLQKLGRDSLGTTPHMLVMTATPIPRTLALTVYGDLDTSVIDELPPGRTQIITKLYADRLRDTAYSRLVEAVAQGRQAYVVYPLVESSDKEGMSELRDATGAAQELAAGALQGLRLGLLHGRLHSEEKDAVMRAFAAHELDVLVATTVIEVGIDVPNATVMVIENAERFGLSQLHQLRGRVGRGSDQSHCFLLVQRPSEDAWRRLMVMEQSSDGFRIAEEDLAIRGPGDFVGTRQAGLPELSLAELGRDQKILLQARADATALLAHDPNLMLPVHAPLSRRLAHSASAKLQLVRVG